MQKVFLLKGLDCPNCSAKIEKQVGELNAVSRSSINLLKQTLTVDFDASKQTLVEKEIKKIVHSHEPDVQVLEYKHSLKVEKEDNNLKMILRLVVGAVVFAGAVICSAYSPLSLCVFVVAYIILGADVVISALKNIIKGRVFDENFLMSVSTVGAFIIGEYPEAVAVMLFYQIGEFFQDLAVRRSRRSISGLLNIRPDSATVIRHGKTVTVSPDTVEIGETVLVKPGERVPLDGEVISGSSMLDLAALTGESVPKRITEGENILSGSINLQGVLHIRVTKSYGDSTAAKIIDLVENASSKKAPTENFITSFARYYTPAVVVLAVLLAVLPPLFVGDWANWINRALVFLVISCPCALVISIPLTFFAGIGAASKRGILVKGGNFLEALNSLDTVVFDKTGTLTKGVFRVSEIIPQNGFTSDELLSVAAKAEMGSNHPIAKSVITAYGKKIDPKDITDYTEIAGKGISVRLDQKHILAGNESLMTDNKIVFTPASKIGTKVYVAVDGVFAGTILISDEIRPDSQNAVSKLKKLGIKKTVMLTGDERTIAESVANELGIDECYAQLLPHQKVEILEQLDADKPKNKKLAFVGDGINDAPVLARADIGIAMGGLGSDAAIEAADVVLMTDEPSKLADALTVAGKVKRIVLQNILIALGVKLVFLAFGAFGIAGMWEAVFGDVGVALIAVFNAMRALKIKIG